MATMNRAVRIKTLLLYMIVGGLIASLLGHFAPLLYYRYAPISTWFEVERVEVYDTTTDSEELAIHFSRTVHHRAQTGNVYLSIYREGNGADPTCCMSDLDRVFTEGHASYDINPACAPFEAGEYYGAFVFEIRIADRITRSVVVETPHFEVRDSTRPSL